MFDIKNNELHVDGYSTTQLVKEFGTPLYIYSENKIMDRIKEIKKHFLDKYPETHAAYACKAFCTLYMCKLIERDGLWLDVVSGGELYTAIRAGFPSNRIEFNGNNKSEDELQMALDYNIARIVVDNVSELILLNELCMKKGVTSKILFRITPGVVSSTHEYITTGTKDSKFGIPLDENIIYPAIEYAINSENLDFLGFHFHVGSQLHDTNAHMGALEAVLSLIKETKARFDYEIRDFNMGGGFGIKYTDEDNPLQLSDFVDPLMMRLTDFCIENGLRRPAVSMEPGRFIIGEAGFQLYTVGNIKKIPGVRTYISVDGGMTDNIRPGLYGSKYNAIIANKADEPKDSLVYISGKCCESTDIIIKNLKCPLPEIGDIIAVFSTGAYGYSMANNYNKLPVPAVVVIKNGKPQLIVKRQSYEQIIENEIL
ncbi:MAG: Diaminopimelate decarboxylase [Clostridiales bacterium 38_11]|nr:MAG: Diaminopimelate decarboxylase [Clostridiales bacterium 38_11]